MDSEPGAGAQSPADKRYEYFAFISYKHEDTGVGQVAAESPGDLPASQRHPQGGPAPAEEPSPHLSRPDRHRRRPALGKPPQGIDRLSVSDRRLLARPRRNPSGSTRKCGTSSKWAGATGSFRSLWRASPMRPIRARSVFLRPCAAASKTMLGVSVEELGKEKAVVKVVAKLLGLKFDRLWDRHRRRQRQQRLLRGLLAARLLLAAAIGGFAYWDYHRTKVAYYADYVERYGVPQGIGELTAAQSPSIAISRGNSNPRATASIAFAASMAAVAAASPRTRKTPIARPIERFHYRDNGALEYTIEFAATGKELRESVYTPDLSIVEFKGGSKGRSQMQAKFLAADTGGLHSGLGLPDLARALGNRGLGIEVRRPGTRRSANLFEPERLPDLRCQRHLCPGVHLHAGRQSESDPLSGYRRPSRVRPSGESPAYSTNTMPKETALPTTWIGAAGTPVLNEDGYAIDEAEIRCGWEILSKRRFSVSTAGPACTRTGMPDGRPPFDERGNRRAWPTSASTASPA